MPKDNNKSSHNKNNEEKIEKKEAELSKTEEDVFEKEFLSIPQLVWRSLKKHKLGITAMWVLLLLYFFAIFADFFAPMQPFQNHINLHS